MLALKENKKKIRGKSNKAKKLFGFHVFLLWAIFCFLCRSSQAACTQIFTPSNVGTSPYPGSNVNTAVQSGNSSTVLCFASGSYGEIDIYNAHPSGRVTLMPASGAAALNPYFNLNGVSNVTVTGFSGSSSSGGLLVQVAGQGNNSNITFSNNAMTSNGVNISNNAIANANILIDHNTFIGFTSSNESSRINIVSDNSCPNGITVSNNTISGGQADGMNTSGASCGTQFLNNDISNIIEANCGGIHCDGFQDNGGGVNTVLDGNYFHNVSNCWQITDGTTNLTMTNNVCTSSSDASHAGQISPSGLTFKHNTIASPLAINIGNDSHGTSSSNIVSTNNIFNGGLVVNGGQNVTGTFTQDYNLCYSGGCSGSHSLSGTPTYVGGANPTTWAGFALTSTSKGHASASDGLDMGITVSGSTPPPPPPSSSACDVNKDNTTNIVDVQQCVNQSLGVAACTADINKDGICNVVDVQRVVNAALGGQCVSP